MGTFPQCQASTTGQNYSTLGRTRITSKLYPSPSQFGLHHAKETTRGVVNGIPT